MSLQETSTSPMETPFGSSNPSETSVARASTTSEADRPYQSKEALLNSGTWRTMLTVDPELHGSPDVRVASSELDFTELGSEVSDIF